MITRPVRPFGWLLPIAKHFEDHDPRVVTRQLLGRLA